MTTIISNGISSTGGYGTGIGDCFGDRHSDGDGHGDGYTGNGNGNGTGIGIGSGYGNGTQAFARRTDDPLQALTTLS